MKVQNLMGKNNKPVQAARMSQDKVSVEAYFTVPGKNNDYQYEAKGFMVTESLSRLRRFLGMKPQYVVKLALSNYYTPITCALPLPKVVVKMTIEAEGVKAPPKVIEYVFKGAKIKSVTSDVAVSSVSTFGLNLNSTTIEFTAKKEHP